MTIVFRCKTCGAEISAEEAAKLQCEITVQLCPLCQGEFEGPFTKAAV